MGCNPWTPGVRALAWLAAAAVLALALAPAARAENAYDRALAEIVEALETNPNAVSPDSINTCRTMLDTAKLLRKMGRIDRAIRRLKACQRLLCLEHQSRYVPTRRRLCFA